MDRPDDELDNLFRNHLAAGLDPMRGQAGRAFAREVTRPMRRRLRINAFHNTLHRVGQGLAYHSRPIAAAGMAMAAAAAIGFFVPRWWESSPSASSPVAQGVQQQWSNGGRPLTVVDTPTPDTNRVWQSPVEYSRYVDPTTHARNEFYVFPQDATPQDQPVPAPAGHQ